MSEAPSVKRQKTNAVDYLWVVDTLPARTLGDILAEAGQKYPEIAARIINEHNKIIAAVQAKTIHFHSQVLSAYSILNEKYSRLSCVKQFEKGFDAANEVQDIIKAIGKATPAHASSETKKNALEALLQIGKIISDCRGELGKEARKEFHYETCFEKTMLRIAKSMTAEERNAYLAQGFERKLAVFERLAADSCVFEKLADVRQALLSAEDFPDEEGEEEEEEDEDEDDDGADGEDAL